MRKTMHKEVLGIFLFFLVIFSLISLLSYNPTDPSIHNATSLDHTYNRFGFLGAHLAGILVGLFGLGAFWVPILIFLFSVHFFHDHKGKIIVSTLAGGMLLVITTGSLLACRKNDYLIFGTIFSSGGLIGISLKSLLIKYASLTGSVIILILIWISGFILSTGFSILIFAQRFWKLTQAFADRIKILTGIWKERKTKSVNRKKTKKEPIIKGKKQGLKINRTQTVAKKAVSAYSQETFDSMPMEKGFQMPSVNLLDEHDFMPSSVDEDHLKTQSNLLEKKLNDFGVNGKVVTVTPGPVITTFEYEPAAGVKINKIVNLTDDLALALRAISIRIVAPIPGKAVIGIEIPNAKRQMVRFKEVVVSDVFEKSKSKMTICLGKDIIGNPVVADLDKMPHLLIAGATGTGKSVALNTMICSLLYKSNPDDVKLIMVDPKRIELSMYDGIPHLITPVVTDVKKATNALFWAVREMERRYEMLSEQKARNINQYNEKIYKLKKDAKDNSAPEKLPYVVIIIDELADLMMVASRDVEVALTRLAQMARAAGIHLILATQRPSVDVLTGIIKANFPTRLTFQVSSKTDSRTIIDKNGAENLLGSGDMLFLPPGTARLKRIHGAYLSETEIARITEFLKNQQTPDYDKTVTKAPVDEKVSTENQEYDERYDDAVALVTKTRQASISMIQRHLRIGYNRAARIVEIMEKEGIVGPSDGAKPRKVLVPGYDNMP